MSREYIDKGIRINRSQRRWHRYGSKILAICIAAAAAIAIIAIAANIGKGGSSHTASGGDSSSGGGNNGSVAVTTASSDGDKTENATGEGSSSATTESGSSEKETTTSDTGGSGKGGTVSGKAKEEEFTSGNFYDDAAFIGDIFVYGIDEYEFIDSSNLYSATFMTASKAMDLASDVSSLKPGKIFVMLGFDDDNLAEDRSAQASADSILELLEKLKDSNPDAKIYAVSEIPISESYDTNGGDYVTQADLDEINALVNKGANSLGIGYIDVSSALKDGDYLSTEYSNDGCHIKKEYYPFVLNGIAAAAK